MTRNSLINIALAIMSILFLCGSAEPVPGSITSADEGVSGACQLSSREIDARHYSLTARVRLLVVWISRPGVGAGRIAWSEGDNGTRELALLIGSDPARAPMKVNRWGYIVERVSGSRAELLGVMTEAEEQSITQARASVSSSTATHSFKSIRSRVLDGTAHSCVNYLKLPEDYTYREVQTLLQRVPNEGGRVRHLAMPEGAEPGFLFAVRSLVEESVDAFRRTGTSGITRPSLRRYAFAGSAFEIRRQSTRVVPEMVIKDNKFHQLLESAFEARNLSTGQLSHFSITYGTQGPVTGIPVRIVYRPRWWFEAEMLLECDSAALLAAQGGAPWNSGTR